ncbi:hypothetical protein X767_26355, partial [Mesorhizobium sp. LSJC264A00]
MLAALAAVMLSAGSAAAQEQPNTQPRVTTEPAAAARSAAQPSPVAVERPAPAAPVAPASPTAGQAAPTAPQPANQPGASAQAEPSAISLTLPHDLSPWGMFMAADIIVKAVMIGLAFASLVTWTVWLAKSLEILFGKLGARRAARAIGNAATLRQAGRSLGNNGGPGALLVRAAEEETALSAGA